MISPRLKVVVPDIAAAPPWSIGVWASTGEGCSITTTKASKAPEIREAERRNGWFMGSSISLYAAALRPMPRQVPGVHQSRRACYDEFVFIKPMHAGCAYQQPHPPPA